MNATEVNTDQAGSDDDAAETNTRALDHELKAMGQLVRILDRLTAPAKGRAVRWLADRYAGEGLS